MLKRNIKKFIKFAAKEFAESIVAEAKSQGLMRQNSWTYISNYEEPSKPYEITWNTDQTLGHNLN